MINLSPVSPPSNPAAGTYNFFLHAATSRPMLQDENGALYPFGSGLCATTSSSGAINTTETLIVGGLSINGSTCGPFPANYFRAGSVIRIVLSGTCTSTVGNTVTFTLRWGTTGTVSDTSIGTFTLTAAGSGTTQAFSIVIDLVIATSGASGTWSGMLHAVGTATGIMATTASVSKPTTSAIDTTLASAYLSCSIKSAASTTTMTLTNCSIEQPA